MKKEDFKDELYKTIINNWITGYNMAIHWIAGGWAAMKHFSLTDFIITNKFTGKPLQPVILAFCGKEKREYYFANKINYYIHYIHHPFDNILWCCFVTPTCLYFSKDRNSFWWSRACRLQHSLDIWWYVCQHDSWRLW